MLCRCALRLFRTRCVIAVLALLVAASTRVLGSYGIGGTLQNVPIERLIRNLEELVAKDAKDGVTRLNLARAHAMAFAQKSEPADEVRVITNNARGSSATRPTPRTLSGKLLMERGAS